MTGRRPPPAQTRARNLRATVDYLGRPEMGPFMLTEISRSMGLPETALKVQYGNMETLVMDLVAYTEASLVSITDQIEAAKLEENVTAARVVAAVLQFAKKNPGLCRLLASDVLFQYAPQSRARVDNMIDWLGNLTGHHFMDLMIGRLRRYVTSGFSHDPTYDLDDVLNLLEPLW